MSNSLSTAFIILTEHCNLHCAYCFHEQEPSRLLGRQLQGVAWISCLDSLSSLGIRNLIITGGEPILHPDCVRFCSEASARGFATLLLTNGQAWSSNLIAQLVRAGVRSVSLSLNQLVELAEPRAISQALGTYDQVIRTLRDQGISWVSAIMVVSRQNFKAVRMIDEWLHARKVGALFQPVYVASASQLTDNLCLSRLSQTEWVELATGLHAWSCRYRTTRYVELWRSLYTSRPLRPEQCLMGTTSLVVRSDGSVTPCFHRQDLHCGVLTTDQPEQVLARLAQSAAYVRAADCFGRHCLSLFMDY